MVRKIRLCKNDQISRLRPQLRQWEGIFFYHIIYLITDRGSDSFAIPNLLCLHA